MVKNKTPAMTGKPTSEPLWEEHGKLLMYTSVGVKATQKVHAVCTFTIFSILCVENKYQLCSITLHVK